MSKGNKGFDMFEYGDGSYAYFAVVTKNYDEADDPEHENEIQVQALPYGPDYDGKSEKLDPDSAKVWLPYLCDLTGFDNSGKDDADTQAYGFHTLPEVGSVVVVLAIESGFAGNAQHVIIGSFWNKELISPGLDDFSYKVAGADEYKTETLKTDKDGKKVLNTSDVSFYRTKAGSTFICDDKNKKLGFFRLKADDKGNEKFKRYFMVDEENQNLDIKVDSFSIIAENVDIRAKGGMEIDNKNGKFFFESHEDALTLTSEKCKDGTFTVEAANEIAFSGKEVRYNKGEEVKLPDGKKPEGPEQEKPEDKNDSGKDPGSKVKVCVVRCVIEANILRPDAEKLGEGKLIRLDKGSFEFNGTEIAKNLHVEDKTFNLSFGDEDKSQVLAGLDSVDPDTKKKLYEVVSDKTGLENAGDFIKLRSDKVDEGFNLAQGSGYQPKDEALQSLSPLIAHADIDLSKVPDEGAVVDLVRKVTLKYTPPKEVKLNVRIHYLDFTNVKKLFSVIEDEDEDVVDMNDGLPPLRGTIIHVNFNENNCIEIKDVPSRSTLGSFLTSNSSEIERQFNNIGKRKKCYVNVSNGFCDPYDDAPSYGAIKPGTVEFDISMIGYDKKNDKFSAMAMSFVRNIDDEETLRYVANMNYKKNSSNKAEEHGVVSFLDELATAEEITNAANAAEGENAVVQVDLYARYDVVRSLPLLLFCRQLTDPDREGISQRRRDAIRKIKAGEYPILRKDVFGESLSKNGGEGNKLWEFSNCATTVENYKDLLNWDVISAVIGVKEDKMEGGALFVPDDAGVVAQIEGFLKKDSALYKSKADADKLVKYDPDRWNRDKETRMNVEGIDGDKILIADYYADEKKIGDNDYYRNDRESVRKDDNKRVLNQDGNGRDAGKQDVRYFDGISAKPGFLDWKRVDKDSRSFYCGNDRPAWDRICGNSFVFVSLYKEISEVSLMREKGFYYLLNRLRTSVNAGAADNAAGARNN